jgi:toxin ParE1/3/4
VSYQILWSDSALERVAVFLDFIAEENPPAARRVIEDLFRRTEILAEQPRLGRPLTDDIHSDLRRLVIGKYVLVYRILETQRTITILAIRHSRERSLPGEDV